MAIKITNKDVIQSYLMTVSKYDFSVYEKTHSVQACGSNAV
jgi:hypothetical protein